MTISKPRVLVVTNNEDANNLLAAVLWLKGLEPYRYSSAKDCIEKFKEMKGKIDVILMSIDIASDRESMPIVNIKRMNPDTKILVIGEEDLHKTRILEYGADEFTLKPMSPENIIDKLYMLISQETIKENR